MTEGRPLNPYALLLHSAPEELHGPIALRLDPHAAEMLLSSEPLPGDGPAAYVIAQGGEAERAVLAGNASVAADDLMALAERADEAIATRLLANPSAPREVTLRVLDRVPVEKLLPMRVGKRNRDLRRLLSFFAVVDDVEVRS